MDDHLVRLLQLTRAGDLAAARELHLIAQRRGDRTTSALALRILLDGGATFGLEHGLHQLTDDHALGWSAQRQRFAVVPATRLAAVVVGQSNETAGERTAAHEQGQPSLAASAAQSALDFLIATPPSAPLCERTREALDLATRVEEIVHRGHLRQRREWLPSPHTRRRRRTPRRRVMRTSVALAVMRFEGTMLSAAACGGCRLYRLRGPRFESLLPRASEAEELAEQSTAQSHAPDEDASEATGRSQLVESLERELEPEDLYVLVGPGFAHVAPLLAAPRLLEPDVPLDQRARRLVRTWAQVASPHARMLAEHELGALLVRLAPP